MHGGEPAHGKPSLSHNNVLHGGLAPASLPPAGEHNVRFQSKRRLNMTKRVKQHQLEDLSRAKYNLAIPSNWVFRDKDKDYGIDAEVEIFDDNDRTTGLVYWVQLKATESKSEAAVKKVDLSIESITYYKQLDIPVLIVRYSKVHDCFYCKWAHEIDLYYAKENAKTLRISFSEDEKWDEQSPGKVKNHLSKIKNIKEGRFKLPIPLSIKIKDNIVNNIPKGVLISSLRTALDEFCDFAIYKDAPADSLLLASLSGDELTINFSSITGCTFHNIVKTESENFSENLITHSLLGFAIALSQVGQFETMSRILLHKKIKDKFFKYQQILFRLLPLVLGTSYFSKALEAVSEAIDDEQDNLLEIIASSAVIFESNRDEEKLKAVESFFHKRLDKYIKIGENSQIGICHYNLGNHYRSRRGHIYNKKAICHYLLARKHENKYLDQHYYYHELGGVLFHAVFFCRRLPTDSAEEAYQLAFEVFKDFPTERPGEVDEWHLKLISLETLLEHKGIKEQIRHKEEALNLIDITKSGAELVALLEKALELDLLCGLAWFNLGIEHSKNGLPEDAVFDFTMCGLSQTGDIEAWVNAILCCFNKKSPINIFPLILRTAYFFNGDRFLEKLYREFNDRCNLEICGQLADAIEEILPKHKNQNERPAIRLLGNDGKFRDIFEKDSLTNKDR